MKDTLTLLEKINIFKDCYFYDNIILTMRLAFEDKFKHYKSDTNRLRKVKFNRVECKKLREKDSKNYLQYYPELKEITASVRNKEFSRRMTEIAEALGKDINSSTIDYVYCENILSDGVRLGILSENYIILEEQTYRTGLTYARQQRYLDSHNE